MLLIFGLTDRSAFACRAIILQQHATSAKHISVVFVLRFMVCYEQ
jgi:hypothetical protein